MYFLEAYSLLKIYKIVHEYTLKCSQLISSSDNKKILLTTRNVWLDSGHYATKYQGPNRFPWLREFWIGYQCQEIEQITVSQFFILSFWSLSQFENTFRDLGTFFVASLKAFLPSYFRWPPLTAITFESGPMPTPWKFLAVLPLLPNGKLG